MHLVRFLHWRFNIPCSCIWSNMQFLHWRFDTLHLVTFQTMSIAIKNSQLANSPRIKYFSQQPCIIILSISVSWMFMVVFFSDSVKQKNSNADIDEAKASAFGAVNRIEYRLQTYSMGCLLFSQGCTNQSYLLDENEYSCAQFFLQFADYLLFYHNGIGARSFIIELAKAYQVGCWKISIIHMYNEHCIWTQRHKRIYHSANIEFVSLQKKIVMNFYHKFMW